MIPDDIIDMSGIEFQWPGKGAFDLIIDRFVVRSRDKLLLLGPSGSGKSTLLSLLAGIVVPAHGKVDILGTDIARLSHAARDRFRAEHCGIVFQMFNLLPYGNVIDNVLLPLHFARRRAARVAAVGTASEARRLLARLGLDGDGIDTQRASSLSVGQQQRVAAARSLIGRPELIIADEPTSALDSDSQTAFLDLLFAEVTSAGSTLVMVSHEEKFAPLFDRVVRFGDIARTTRG
jgi:putative ABC transport system ATP-binding protein